MHAEFQECQKVIRHSKTVIRTNLDKIMTTKTNHMRKHRIVCHIADLSQAD